MAVAGNIDIELYDGTFLDTIRRTTVFRRTANLAYEAQLRRGQSVRIPYDKTDYSSALTSAAGTIASWTYATPTAVSFDGIIFDWTMNFNSTHALAPEDVRNIQANTIAQVAEQKALAKAEEIDSYCASTLNSTNLSAVINNKANSTTSDQAIVVGSNTNFLNANGTKFQLDAGSNEGQDTILNGIRTLKLKMAVDNKLGAAAMMPEAFAIVMHPAPYAQLMYYADTLSDEVFAERNLAGNNLMTLLGIPVYQSSALAAAKFNTTTGEFVTTGGKDCWPIYLLARKGVAYADTLNATIQFDPPVNQTGYFTTLHTVGQCAYKVIDDRYVYRLVVRASA